MTTDNNTSENQSSISEDDKVNAPWVVPRSVFHSPEIPKLKEGDLPSKLFYTLQEAAKIAKCTEHDLLHFAGLGKLRLHTPVPPNVFMHAGDPMTGYWGKHDFLMELLAMSSYDCRKIELHGSVWQDMFFLGWAIEHTGHPVLRRPLHIDDTVTSVRGMWGCFSQNELTSVEILMSKLFVMSFDLDMFIKGTYQSTNEVLPKSTHEHRSDKLRLMNQAALVFWGESIDPEDKSTHPKNAVVSAWLQDKKFTENLANAAASLIRPDFAGHSGRPLREKSNTSDLGIQTS